MKKILVIACFFLFFVNGVLSQSPCNFPGQLCESNSIIYQPGSRWCNDGYTTLDGYYRINVSSSATFSSSWTTSNSHMITFDVYGPFTSLDNNNIDCNVIYTPGNLFYSAGGSNVTNVNFSSNLPSFHVQNGSYVIHITFDICSPILNFSLRGVSCGETPAVLPSLPFTYKPAIIDTSSTEVPCENCETFQPIAGNDYWLSAWVKEDHTNQVKSYLDSYVELTFTSSGVSPLSMSTTGEIIDGWQRIVGKFTVPIGTTDIHIDLVNNSGVDAYFDDVRIHPFNGSMKSYVYDPETLWLNAELDDNNYATVYEYDKEGGLVRIKKETSRGMVTIQETRSNTQKQH